MCEVYFPGHKNIQLSGSHIGTNVGITNQSQNTSVFYMLCHTDIVSPWGVGPIWLVEGSLSIVLIGWEEVLESGFRQTTVVNKPFWRVPK